MAINKDFIIPDAGLQVNGATVVSSTLGVNGAVTVANTLAVGNTTITGNLVVTSAANVTGAANVGGTFRAGGLITGAAGADITGTANASVAINVGANVNLSLTSINVGNSTVNSIITQTQLRTGNTSNYANISPTEIRTTGLIAVTGNATFSNSVAVTGNATLSNTLAVTGAATFSNNVTISGDLTVSGTTTYVNTATLNIADNIITLNADVTNVTAPTENAGIEVNRGSAANVQIRWNESTDRWQVTNDGTNYGDILTKLVDVVLGTDTSGNYVATVSSANGIAGSGTGEGSTPTLYAVGANGITVTAAGINVLASNGLLANTTALYVVAGTELTSNSSGVHHNDITRTNNTSTASPASGGTFTAIDSVTTNARGHVTAVNTKTVTLPVDPNTTYVSASIANTIANQGISRLTSSSNANTDVLFVGQDEITVTSNSTAIYIDHNDNARTDTTTGNTSPNYAGTFTAVDSITTNARGHVTAVNTKTVTMPSSNNTTYDLAAVANTTTNEGRFNLVGSDLTTDTVRVSGVSDLTASSNATHVILTHDDIARSNTTTGNTSPNYGGTFTAVDSITTNARGHITAVNTKTVTMPSSNNTTYTTSTVANTIANQGLTRLTSSSNANTDTSIVGLDEITVSSNSTAVYIDHNDIARTNDTSSASPASGGTFTAIDSVTTNARGHVTAVNTKTVTLPVDPNTTYTSASVANTAANQGLARLTSSSNANTDVLFVGQDEITVTSNSTAIYIDHNDISRTDTTNGNTSPNYAGTFTAVDSITTNARGHVTGINTKTVTMPSSNNTTYTSSTVANTVANQGITRLTSSGNANTDTSIIGLDEIVVSSNSTAVYVDHIDVTRTDTSSSASPASGGTFTAVDSVTTNARGHLTALNLKTVTLPVDPNTTYTSSSVANTAANEGRIRLTSSGNVNTDVLVVGQGDVTVTSNATALYINSISYGIGTTTGSTNLGYIQLTRAGTTALSANVIGVNEILLSSNSSGVYVDHNTVSRSDTTSSASPASGGTFTAVDSVTTNARGHITALNLKTVTLPIDPNTTYTGANGVALSGTQFYAAVGATLVSNSTGIHLPSVATAGSSTGGISAITIDAQGRVTSVTGSAGYVTSSGVTSVASGSGLTGGTITTTGTLSVLANTGIVANSTGLFVNLDAGATKTAAKFYTGTSNPSNTNRLNYDGNLYVTNLYAITEVYAAASDDRLKTNVQPIQSALDKLESLQGFTFNWNETANELGGFDTNKQQVGVSAQQVQAALPEAIGPAPFDIDKNGGSKSGENYLTVQYEKLVPLLIEAIKELKAEVAELKKDR